MNVRNGRRDPPGGALPLAAERPAQHVGVDTQILLKTSAQDPEREVLRSPSFSSRIGTEPLGFRLRVPDAWTVPDAGQDNPYGLTPNACYAILLPDGEHPAVVVAARNASGDRGVSTRDRRGWRPRRP